MNNNISASDVLSAFWNVVETNGTTQQSSASQVTLPKLDNWDDWDMDTLELVPARSEGKLDLRAFSQSPLLMPVPGGDTENGFNYTRSYGSVQTLRDKLDDDRKHGRTLDTWTMATIAYAESIGVSKAKDVLKSAILLAKEMTIEKGWKPGDKPIITPPTVNELEAMVNIPQVKEVDVPQTSQVVSGIDFTLPTGTVDVSKLIPEPEDDGKIAYGGKRLTQAQIDRVERRHGNFLRLIGKLDGEKADPMAMATITWLGKKVAEIKALKAQPGMTQAQRDAIKSARSEANRQLYNVAIPEILRQYKSCGCFSPEGNTMCATARHTDEMTMAERLAK